MAQPPQQGEIGIDLAVEHRLQIELDVSWPGQPDVVAENTELEPIADEAPQMALGAVEA